MRHQRIALLALPTLINAVALSDMAPQAQNLPPACEAVYTEQISGCTSTDFKTRQCTESCVQALDALVQPIQNACGNQGVKGENLIVAFLANVGPQQLCPNGASAPGGGGVSTTNTYGGPFTGSSPTAPPIPTSDTSSLLVDTSSSMTPTMTPTTSSTWSSQQTSTIFKGTSTASSIPSTSGTLEVDTTKPTTAAASKTTSATNSQMNLHDHSGGGSPFDTAGNLGAASSISLSLALALLSATAAVFMIFP